MTSRKETEPTDADASDAPSLPLSALLFWKLARLLVRFLWNLTLAIIASVVAALILLIGANAVLGFGSLGVSFVFAFFKTVINLVLLFVACAIVSCVALVAIASALGFVSARPTTVVSRLRLHRVQLLARRAVRKMRTLLVVDVAGIVFIMVVILMFAYLNIRDAKTWNATLRVQLPTRAPVERIGRTATASLISKLADVPKYVNDRRDHIAAEVSSMTQLALSRSNHPLTSRCGNALALHPSEASVVAELYVDLAQAPPILKHEYILTEEEVTAALSLLAKKSRGDRGPRPVAEDDDNGDDGDDGDEEHAGVTLDCVKVHPNYLQLFTTSVKPDGSKQNRSFGMSMIKERGSLRMVLDEVSVGRASFQIGWMGLGIIGSKGFVNDAEGMEDVAEALRAFDSRVFSMSLFEGYMHVVTWQLPSVVAARAAIDVGYTQQPVEHRVEPRDDAASVGAVRAGDLVYVLERTDEWLYVCSEVSGRFGWLPKSTFTSLENWPGFVTQRQVTRSQSP